MTHDMLVRVQVLLQAVVQTRGWDCPLAVRLERVEAYLIARGNR